MSSQAYTTVKDPENFSSSITWLLSLVPGSSLWCLAPLLGAPTLVLSWYWLPF